MADHELLEILLDEGVDFWNHWLSEHPQVYPDFSGADLRNRDLAGANLRWSEMQGTDMTGARLDSVDLHDSDITAASFVGASLKESRP